MLLVQKFLEENTFSQLENIHGIFSSLSKDKKKVLLNYGQIEAKNNDPLACQCRSLILSKEDHSEFKLTSDLKLDLNTIIGKTKIVNYGMNRFFNFGQGEAFVNFNDPNLIILEKVDGSIISVYNFEDSWNCASRSVPDADQLLNNGLYTFRQLFEKAVKETLNLSFDEFTNYLDKTKTYCFELMTPYNTVVVKHNTFSICLLAVRDLISLKEEDPKNQRIFKELNCPTPQIYKLQTIEEVVQWVAERDPTKYEGVIFKDSQYNRIKVKSPSYVALSRIKENLDASNRNIMELILSEKEDDVVPLLEKELVEKISSLKEKLVQFLKTQDNIYLEVSQYATSKKHFAQEILVKDNVWSPALFQIFDGKAKNTKDFILQNRKNGTWTNSFLDKIIEQCEKIK